MASYLSPASFQTPNSFQASGTLGGFLAGMNQDYANQITNRGLRDSDLEFAIRQLAQQKEQSDLAVTQADNANKILAAGVTKGLYDSGAKQQEAEATTAASTAQAKEKTSHADVQDKLNSLSLYSQMGAEAEQMWHNQAQPMNPQYAEWWKGWQQKLKPYLPNMPTIGDNGDLQIVQQRRQAAINSIPQIQALQQIHAKGDESARTATITATDRLQGQMERAQASRDVQILKNQAAAQHSAMVDKMEKLAMPYIKQINDSGGIKTPEQFQTVMSVAEVKADEQLAKDPSYQDQLIINPKVAAQRREMLIDNFGESLSPGFKKIKNGNIPTKQSQPQTQKLSSGGPKTGDVQDGYKFKGGDPSDQKNWEKVN